MTEPRTACIVISSARALTGANGIWEAMGHGPGNLTVPVGPIEGGEATHYLGHFASMPTGDVNQWADMIARKVLPDLAGRAWGQDGLPERSEAQRALLELCVIPSGQNEYDASRVPESLDQWLETMGLRRLER